MDSGDFNDRILDRRCSLSVEQIDLIVYDFDGVMTDNRVFVLEDGTEGVLVNRSDGLAVSLVKNAGIPQIILSSEVNAVVKMRADKLGIPALHNVTEKAKVLKSYSSENGYDLKRIVYIGNDINDLEAMKSVGIPVAPADAHPIIKRTAKIVLNKKGGMGAIREFYDLLIGDQC